MLTLENIKRKFALKLPARASLWSIVSGLVARGVGVVGTPIFTRLLTPEEYGLYPLYTTWLSLASVVVTLGITGGAIYRGLQRYAAERDRFVSAAMGLLFAILLPALFLLTFFGEEAARLTGLPLRVLSLMLAEIFFTALIAISSARYKYEYRYKTLALTSVLSAVATPTISVLIVLGTPYRAEARVLGALASALLIGAPQAARAIRRGGRLYDGEIWRYLLRVSVPLLPHYISSALIMRVSEMVIGRTHGQEALGKYSVALSVGMALTVLTNGLGQVFSPWILRKLAAGRADRIRDALSLGLRGLLLAALLLLSVAPELIAIITPVEYHDALGAVYPLALSTGAIFISNMTMTAETYYERSARSSLPTVAVAILSIVLGVSVLPRVDYRLAAVFTLVAYVLLAALNSLTLEKMSGERIIELKRLIFGFLGAAAYAVLLFLLRDVFISRILLALPLFPPILALGVKVWREVREN